MRVYRPLSNRLPRWSEKHAELCKEYGPLAGKLVRGEISPAERRILAHVRRELDWYEMAMLRPDFERMEAQVREHRRLGREIRRLVAKVRKELPAAGVP